MKKDRKENRKFRWLIAGAAAFFWLQTPAADALMQAEVALASSGAQTGAETEEAKTQPDGVSENSAGSFVDFLNEEQKKVLEELLTKLENGEISTQEEIEKAIDQAEEQLDITLTQEQRDQVEQLLRQANELGLDQEDILNGAQKLYEQYGSALMESADAAIRENIVEPVKDAVVEETKNTFRDFFRDMGNTVRDFVMSLIG